jgi:hypothetical protein
MRLPLSPLLMQLFVSGELLPQKLLLGVPFFELMLTSSFQTLVVIEYSRANCLLGPVLAYDIFVYAFL